MTKNSAAKPMPLYPIRIPAGLIERAQKVADAYPEAMRPPLSAVFRHAIETGLSTIEGGGTNKKIK